MEMFKVYVPELNTFFTAYRKEIELIADNVLAYGFEKEEFMSWFENKYPNAADLSSPAKQVEWDWFYANNAIKNYALLVYGDWLNKFSPVHKDSFVPEYHLPMSKYNEFKKHQNAKSAKGINDDTQIQTDETRPIR